MTDAGEDGRPVEIRVLFEAAGSVHVHGPRGLGRMRIVASPDRMPGAIGQAVAEMAGDVIGMREARAGIPRGSGAGGQSRRPRWLAGILARMVRRA